jgi:hypothetical protein
LIDIAELVFLARRSLSFAYVVRYNLCGRDKQIFFDFQLSELEQSLEKLNHANEADWLCHIDMANTKQISLKKSFFVTK